MPTVVFSRRFRPFLGRSPRKPARQQRRAWGLERLESGCAMTAAELLSTLRDTRATAYQVIDDTLLVFNNQSRLQPPAA